MLLLQRHQLAHEGVVLVIRDLRIVEDVVAVVVAADRLAQRSDPRGGGLGRGHRSALGPVPAQDVRDRLTQVVLGLRGQHAAGLVAKPHIHPAR